MDLVIRKDDLRGPQVIALLEQHLCLMRSITPAESIHALGLDRLRARDVTAWTAWHNGELLGCGALKELEPLHGEIKSMHTAPASRGRGVGTTLLRRILDEARDRDYRRLSLETGSQPEFAAARSLYQRHGFWYCPPFGDYREDPNSVFMTRGLGDAQTGG
jgi:putative acetyltransferase